MIASRHNAPLTPRSCSLTAVAAGSLLGMAALSPGAAGAAPLKPVALVNYTPALCMGPAITPVEVYVDLATGTTRPTAVRLERRYRPKAGATLTIAGKRYGLSPTAARGVVYADRIIWNFQPIKVSAAQGEHAVGTALTLRYKSTSGNKTVHGTVRPAGCVQ